jgi:copper chaperone
MNRVLLGVRGLEDAASIEKVLEVLRKIKGVEQVTNPHPGQVEVVYDSSLTVMDFIRAIRSVGFLAGML